MQNGLARNTYISAMLRKRPNKCTTNIGTTPCRSLNFRSYTELMELDYTKPRTFLYHEKVSNSEPLKVVLMHCFFR